MVQRGDNLWTSGDSGDPSKMARERLEVPQDADILEVWNRTKSKREAEVSLSRRKWQGGLFKSLLKNTPVCGTDTTQMSV